MADEPEHAVIVEVEKRASVGAAYAGFLRETGHSAKGLVAVSQSGHPAFPPIGVRRINAARAITWNRKQPSPGPRSESRSAPL